MPPEDPHQAQWFKTHLLPHKQSLKTWLSSQFSETADFDDIIQEAFLRVLKIQQEKSIQSPKALLFRTARNLAIDNAKSFRVSRSDCLGEIDDLIVIDKEPLAHEQTARTEELELMTRAVQSLPERCRQVFTLRKVYGLSQREVARRLGLSEKTISAQITIGMQKCNLFLVKYYAEKGPKP